MALHREAKTASIRLLCTLPLSLAATPASAQSSGADLPVEGPSPPAAAPVSATSEPPAPPEPPSAPARWELATTLSGSVYTIHVTQEGFQLPDQSGKSGSITAGPIVYLTPVIDDDAPRSLQPFLQRTSTVSATITGDGFITESASRAFTRKSSLIGLSAGVDRYVTRGFALTGGLGYSYSALHDGEVTHAHGLSASAGFGVRLGDVRLDASYTFDARDLDGTFATVRWGTVNAAAYAVVAKSVVLRLYGLISDGGGGGGGSVGYYTTKDIGLFLGGSGRAFVYYLPEVHSHSFSGWAGISCWATPSARVYGTYSLNINQTPAQPGRLTQADTIEHALSVSVNVRIP